MISRPTSRISPQLSATLDFLRWTSALAVLIGHVRMFLFQPIETINHGGIWLKMFYLLTGFGHQAVMIFFVLSGYLVGGRVAEKIHDGTFRMTEYMADRISRLYPVLVGSLVLTLLLDAVGITFLHNANHYASPFTMLRDLVNYNLGAQSSFGTLISNFLMLQGLATPPFGTNGPLWSLSMEFWYYILFPLLLIPFYTKRIRTRGVAIAILSLALLLLSKKPEYYSLFIIWLFGVAARRFSIPFKNSPMAFALLTMALANSRFGYGPYYSRDLLVGLCCMLVIVAIQNGGRGITFGASFSKQMAGFSYSLYCCHFPIVVLSVAVLAACRDVAALEISSRFMLATALIIFCLGICYAVSLFTEAKTHIYRKYMRERVGMIRRTT